MKPTDVGMVGHCNFGHFSDEKFCKVLGLSQKD